MVGVNEKEYNTYHYHEGIHHVPPFSKIFRGSNPDDPHQNLTKEEPDKHIIQSMRPAPGGKETQYGVDSSYYNKNGDYHIEDPMPDNIFELNISINKFSKPDPKLDIFVHGRMHSAVIEQQFAQFHEFVDLLYKE